MLFHLNKIPMKHKKKIFLVVLFALLLAVTSCTDTKALSLQKQFGNNSYYFMGLKYLQEGQKEDALAQFKKGVKKSDDFFAEKCLESLCQLASENEGKVLAQELVKKFPSNDNRLKLERLLYAAEEYEQILAIAENEALEGLVAEEKPAESMYLRLLSLEKSGKQGFAGEIEDWFFQSPLTSFHKKYYDSHKDSLIASMFSEETQQCIKLRVAVYQRDYSLAVNLLAAVLQTQDDWELWLVRQPAELLSDIGKALLYGTNALTDAAQFLDGTASKILENEPDFVAFYVNFYAARLYDKGLGTGNKKAVEKFLTTQYYPQKLWSHHSPSSQAAQDFSQGSFQNVLRS